MNDSIRILLVDDELDFAETLAERLRMRSFDVHVVGRAEEALSEIDSGWKPDVVLLDLKMPGMDGMDALSEIKEREPNVETILLTGHGAASSSIEGMKRGAYDYMMKPVDIAELVERVQQAAAKKREAD